MLMEKREAIEKMVDSFSTISQEQFRTLAEAQGEYFVLPMWGTMFRMDYFGDDLYNNARIMLSDLEELKDDAKINPDKYTQEEHKKIEAGEWLEEYIDEEMSGSHCILDNDGDTTVMFIYELNGEYWIGINGAGWDFYDGVWDKLYDICGLKWHDSE